MNFKFRLLLLLLAMGLPLSTTLLGQCNLNETITFCDITTIDFNSDTTPDGIIDLYEEFFKITGTNLEQGIWETRPEFRTTIINANLGTVSVWDLPNATTTENTNDYTFTLFNSSCGSTPAATITLILAPYSGIALPASGVNDINLEVCNSSPLNLFTSLTSTENIPPPHLNGTWTLISAPSNATVLGDGNLRTILIEYQPGPPLVDQAVLEFRYTVEGNTSCTENLQTTDVRISVVRQVSAGVGSFTEICESQIEAGEFDANINLRDDRFLIGEDIEGFFIDNDGTSEITGRDDSEVNIRRIYEDIVASTPNFKTVDFSFSYQVEKRSGVCTDNDTIIPFRIYERLKDFRQRTPTPRLCINEISGGTLNLFDFLEFSSINTGGRTINFIYDNDLFVKWRFVSGPSNLDLMERPNNIDNPSFDTTDFFLGTVNTSAAAAGTYVFEFGVSSNINGTDIVIDQICDPFAAPGDPAFCTTNPCENLFATISFELLPFESAGVDTAGIVLCETMGNVSLRSLLNEAAGLPISTTGIWTNDASGNVVDDNFVFPSSFTDGETFNFTYTVTPPTGSCIDSSNLSFSLSTLKSDFAGEDATIAVCIDDRNIRLFDQLGGSPSPTGTWSGPEGYRSADHIGEFIFNDLTLPRLLEGVYTYTTTPSDDCITGTTATVTINIVAPEVLTTETTEATFCKVENSVDLISLLPSILDTTGTFNDPAATGALTGSVVNFATLLPATYIFEYSLPLTGPCAPPIFTINLTVLDEVSAGSAGEDAQLRVCADRLSLNLFDQLGGTPEPTGTWSGPFGYRSFDHLGAFSATNPDIQRLANGVYTYTVGGGRCSSSTDTATVTIEIIEPTPLEDDLSFTRCKSDGSLNLFSLLSNTTNREGTFVAIEQPESLSPDGRVDFSLLPQGTYNFEYRLVNEAPCEPSTLTIEVKIVDLETPEVPQVIFCILDAKHLSDIEVNIPNFNWYIAQESDVPILDNPILKDNTTLFLANVDSENCESERVEVPIRILNVGESVLLEDENGNTTIRVECPLDFQDGVSPNQDGQNDTFSLIKEGEFNVPEAFPDFSFEVYNRFGTRVFNGNISTGEFKGESNVSLSIGDLLPSGVYFYVFNPNFKNNASIQGSFYLSK